MKTAMIMVLALAACIQLQAKDVRQTKKKVTLQQFLNNAQILQKADIELKKKEIILLNMRENLLGKMEGLNRAEKNLKDRKKQLEKLKTRSFYTLIKILKSIPANKKEKDKK